MLALSLSQASTAEPFRLTVGIENGTGGQVDGLPGGDPCRTDCQTLVRRSELVSLLAEADPGYRFAEWQGDCEATLGPLCTLPVTGDAIAVAQFVPDSEPEALTEAVLLLHDQGETPAVWNKLVDRQFAGVCPAVYGGVVLGQTAVIQPDALRCYRLRFGYYAALGGPDAPLAASVAELQSEIRAAVAGLLDARPNLRLLLAGRGWAVAAAERFLASPSPEQAAVIGLLAVDANSRAAPADPSRASEADLSNKALERLRSR